MPRLTHTHDQHLMRPQAKMSYLLHAVLLLSYFNCNNAKLLATLKSEIENRALLNIIEEVYEEETFETIFLLKEVARSCVSTNELETRTKIPLILATVNATEDKLKNRFNSKILAIVCLPDEQQPPQSQLLKVLAANLQHRRQTRILLYHPAIKASAELLALLSVYLEEHYMTKVIAFFDASSAVPFAPHFYRYHPFPSSHWQLVPLNPTQNYFLTHENNLQGRTFVTQPSQILPRCIVLVDSADVPRLSGYVGYLMNTFVAKHNITLRFLYPVKAGELVHLTTLLKYVTNGTIDFAVTLVPLFYDLSETYPLLAYPLETIRWFIVLPCPQPLAYAEIYKIVITAHVFGALLIFSLLFSLIDTVIKHLFYTSHAEFDFVNILVNENIFRGIFGLSFLIRRRPVLSLKILYLFLMLLGLFVSNMYSAYFQTLFTSPPLQEEIQTFDDMRRTGLKLMVDRNEIKSIVDSFAFISNKTFQNILQLEDTGTFQRHRRDYDNTYGYTMPESLWPIFKAQQETYDSHIFCLAPSLQLFSGMSLGAPLAENSYLTAPLSMLILRVIETGLLAHWRTRTFLDLVESKQLYFKRPAEKQLFHDISVNDVQFPFYLLLGGLFGSSILFTLEIYTFKLRKSQKQKS